MRSRTTVRVLDDSSPEYIDLVLPQPSCLPPRPVCRSPWLTALLRAILQDAILCWQKRFTAAGQSGKRSARTAQLAADAHAWLFGDEEDWPLSFVNVCAALGLNPAHVRMGLKRWGDRPRDRAQRTGRCRVRIHRATKPSRIVGPGKPGAARCRCGERAGAHARPSPRLTNH